MNPLLMLMLLAPNALSGLTGGATGSLSSILPLMLMTGGLGSSSSKLGTGMMLGLSGAIPVTTGLLMDTMGKSTTKRSYRRSGYSAAARAAYWKGRALGTSTVAPATYTRTG